MCIRVQCVPRHLLDEPWDASRQLITIPGELKGNFALRAVRAVLTELDIEQEEDGARCWCGESIQLLAYIPQQRKNDEVINLGA